MILIFSSTALADLLSQIQTLSGEIDELTAEVEGGEFNISEVQAKLNELLADHTSISDQIEQENWNSEELASSNFLADATTLQTALGDLQSALNGNTDTADLASSVQPAHDLSTTWINDLSCEYSDLSRYIIMLFIVL